MGDRRRPGGYNPTFGSVPLRLPALTRPSLVNRTRQRLPTALTLVALAIGPSCEPTPSPGGARSADAGASSLSVDPGAVDEATFEAARNKAFQLNEARGDINAAREALLVAHAMRPEAFGVNKRLGAVYAELRLNLPAVDHYRKALAAHPDDNSVRQSLVALLAMIDADEEMLRELPILRADPDHVGEALYLEARLRDMRGDRETAQALLSEADGLPAAEVYRALSLHGRFVFQYGDYSRAQALFARAQEARPDYKEAVKGLADCALRLGRSDEAEHWGTILSLLLDLTDDEYIKKNDDLRRQKLVALLELMPEYTTGFKLLADLHRQAGEVSEACAVIERFIALHSDLLQADDLASLRAHYCREKQKAGP